MDKYLQSINEKEKEIKDIESEVENKKILLKNITEEKTKNEAIITDLEDEYRKNIELKLMISNLPELKKTLKKLFLLFTGIFVLPVTLILGSLAIIASSWSLALLTLVSNLVIVFKVKSDYNHRLEELISLIGDATIESLEDDNLIIKEKERKVVNKLSELNQIIYEIETFLRQSDNRKKAVQEDINHIRFMRESAISSHCEDILNTQYSLDEKEEDMQKRLLPNNLK